VGLVGADSGAVVTLGTSAWISMATDRPVRDPQQRIVAFDHVVPGHFVPLGAMQSAGASLGWFASTVGVAGADIRSLVQEAGAAEASSEGLFFLPYLLGERAPIWDVNARGAFIGLEHHHTRAQLTRAVLEGVAFNLYGVFEAMSESVRPIDSVDAVGGGAKGDTWLQLMADTWGVPVRRRTIVDEANSLGAAIIGARAVGLVDDWAAARELSQVEAVFEPDASRHERLAVDYRRFTDAYLRLRDWFA
jgi:xylulokinase